MLALFGILVAMAIYHLFLLLSTGEKIYLWYTVLVLTVIGNQAPYLGFLPQIISTNPWSFQTAYLEMIVLIEFARRLLNFKVYSPLINKIFIGTLFIFGILLFSSFFSRLILLLYLATLVSSFLILSFSIQRCFDRYRPAYFITLGCSIFMIFQVLGGIQFTLISMGANNILMSELSEFILYNPGLYGVVIQFLSMGLAVGDKIRLDEEKSRKTISNQFETIKKDTKVIRDLNGNLKTK
jgi:hypothetical protein